MRPVVLTANTPRSFYRGTGRIHRFRGLPAPADEYHPEAWIASTTARFGSAPLGLTTLPGGRPLAAPYASTPEAWLEPPRLQRNGAQPNRRARHANPSRGQARDHAAHRPIPSPH